MGHCLDEILPFDVEMNASDDIATNLNQASKPVTFFLKTLNASKQKHCTIEKQVYAIVKSLHKWQHYLMGHHLILLTDQKSVLLMLDSK